MKVKIEVVKEGRLKLGHFEQGVPTRDVLDGLDFARENENIHSQTPFVKFEGKKTSSNYAIGQYDPSSGTLKIMPTTMYHIKQIVLKSAPKPPVLSEKEKAKRIVEQFGSKAIQKSTKTKEAFRMEKVSTKYEKGSSDETKSHLPPCNKSATTIEEAYPLDDLIPPDVKSHINFFSNSIKKKVELSDIIAKSPYDPLIHNLLKAGFDKNEKAHYYKVLEFLGILIRLSRIPSRSGSVGESQFYKYFGETVDQRVLSYLIDTFCEMIVDSQFKKSYKITTQGTDKIMCYLVVVYFHVMNGEGAIFPLAQSVGLFDAKLKRFFEEVGSKFKKDGDQLVGYLTFPLTFKSIGKMMK